MPVTRSLEAHSTVAEQSSAESSSDPQSPKRPALVPKKAGKSKVDATQPLSQAQRRASSGNKNGILRPSIKGSGTQVSKAVGRVPPATTAAHALLPHLATTAHASLPGLPVFGRTSSRFTFTAPSYISLSDLATPPPQPQPQQPQATIVISDSENDDMDIDMLDDSEIQIIEAMAPSSGYTPVVSPVAQFSPTLATPAQRTPPLTAPATPPAPPRPADIISPATNSQLPKPIVIYLDDSPESNKQAGRSYTVSKSAVEISKDVTTYIYNTLSCGFTRLLSERLEKGLTSSYAGNWITTLGEMFDPPPWRSATVMLTVLLYYWDPIFSLVFPRSFGASIRDVIPWVMRVECLAECPQTRKELPQRLRFAPFAYSSEASAANPADSALDKELMQDAESRAETVKLVYLAKRLLAQSALIESDAQERRRLQLFDDWVAWQKTHG
ncbi:hypothetical protein GGF38_003116 [Coemansia sp. RSA 25]|nr:hypothetical protein GGF38_003116 [Coemansia sp. RSA 25]